MSLFLPAVPYSTPHPQSDYLHMVKACAERDRQQVIERSTTLGVLTGGWPPWSAAGLLCGGSGVPCLSPLPAAPCGYVTQIH